MAHNIDMYVALATIADFASVEAGNINIIGARQMIGAEQLPGRAKTLAIVFVVAAEAGDHNRTMNAKLIGYSPDGSEFFKSDDQPVTIPPPDEALGISSMNLILNSGGMLFTQEGPHKIKLIMDGNEIHEIKFAVIVKGAS